MFLTHYALRHGKKEGDSQLCGWTLQGSIDGEDWKELNTVNLGQNDTLKFDKEPYPYYDGTWAFINNVGAFRYFKIEQVGKNSSNKYGIYLYGIELYGVLCKA